MGWLRGPLLRYWGSGRWHGGLAVWRHRLFCFRGHVSLVMVFAIQLAMIALMGMARSLHLRTPFDACLNKWNLWLQMRLGVIACHATTLLQVLSMHIHRLILNRQALLRQRLLNTLSRRLLQLSLL